MNTYRGVEHRRSFGDAEKRTSCYALLLHIFYEDKANSNSVPFGTGVQQHPLAFSNSSSTPPIWHTANNQHHIHFPGLALLHTPRLIHLPASLTADSGPSASPRRCRLPTRHQYVMALRAFGPLHPFSCMPSSICRLTLNCFSTAPQPCHPPHSRPSRCRDDRRLPTPPSLWRAITPTTRM